VNITLSGKQLVLVSGLRWSKVPGYSPSVRTTGQQNRADKVPIPEWAPSDLSGGLGRKYYRSDRNQFHMATANTFWEGQITLPLLPSTATLTGTADTPQITHMVNVRGTLFGFYVLSGALKFAQWSGSGWVYDDEAVATGAANIWGATALQGIGEIWVLYSNGATAALRIAYSSDAGVTWTNNPVVYSTIALNAPGVLRPNPVPDKMLVAGNRASDTSQAFVGHVDNVGVVTATLVVASSSYGVTGLALIDSASPQTLYIATPSEVLKASDSGSAITKVSQIISFEGVSATTNGRGLCAWNGNIMIPTQDGGLLAYDPSTGLVIPVGLDSGEGLPADYIGDITALLPDRYTLYAWVKGTNSAIYAFDGTGWHCLYTTASSIQLDQLAVIGTTQPAIIFSPTAGTYSYLKNYHTNPLEISGATYAASGYIDYPIFGGDSPEMLANFHYLSQYARSLNQGTEEIEWWAGLNGDAPDKLIGVMSEAGQRLWLPSNIRRARTIQLRAILRRGATNTNTPVLHYPILGTNRLGESLLSVSAEIDIRATAAGLSTSQEEVLGLLEDWVRQGELLELSWRSGAVLRMDVQGLAVREHEGSYTAQLTLVQV